MTKFGYISKPKVVNETHIVHQPVKSWRAKVAEWLLGTEIDELEQIIWKQQAQEFDKRVAEECNSTLKSFMDDYKRQLDEEILDLLDIYTLQFSTEFDPLGMSDPTELRTIETKDIHHNGRVIRVPRRFVKRKEGSSLKNKLEELAEEYDLPSITTWKQGRFIDQPQYKHMGSIAKQSHEEREMTLIRPGGGTNNALFRVALEQHPGKVAEYLEKVGNILRKEAGE